MRTPRPLSLSLVLLATLVPLAAQELPSFDDPGVSLVGILEQGEDLNTLTKDEIETSGVADLGALLEAMNLPLNRNGAFGQQVGVGIRGMGSGRVVFLINGVPMNSAQNGTFDLGQMALESLQGVEVIPGGSDTRYSVTGAVGGVVNLVTVPKPKAGLAYSARISSLSYLPDPAQSSAFDTQGTSLALTWGGKELSWALDASGHGAANRYAEVSGHGAWDTGGGGSIAWSGSGIDFVGSTRASYVVKSIPPGDQTDLNTVTSLKARVPQVGSDALGADLLVYHNHGTMTWRVPSSTSRHDLDTVGWRHEWAWSANEALLVLAGLDGEYHHLSSSDVGLVDQVNTGLFLTPVINWGPDLEVVPSVKLVVGPGAGQLLVPKLGLLYRLGESTMKANAFRTFKWPTINDRLWPADAYAAGNPDLRPEDGVGADLSWEAGLGTGVYEATVHGAYQSEAILWQSSGGRWRPENLGRAAVYGFDAGLKIPLAPTFLADGRYSLLFTHLLTDGLTLADQRRMPYKPLHTVSLGARWRWASGSLGVRGHAESLRYTSTLNLYSLPPFATLDLMLDQSLGQGLVFFSSLTNALNAKYQSVEGYPLPGASLTAGLRLTGSARSHP